MSDGPELAVVREADGCVWLWVKAGDGSPAELFSLCQSKVLKFAGQLRELIASASKTDDFPLVIAYASSTSWKTLRLDRSEAEALARELAF